MRSGLRTACAGAAAGAEEAGGAMPAQTTMARGSSTSFGMFPSVVISGILIMWRCFGDDEWGFRLSCRGSRFFLLLHHREVGFGEVLAHEREGFRATEV